MDVMRVINMMKITILFFSTFLLLVGLAGSVSAEEQAFTPIVSYRRNE